MKKKSKIAITLAAAAALASIIIKDKKTQKSKENNY